MTSHPIPDSSRSVRLLWWVVLLLLCAHFDLAYFQIDHPLFKLEDYMAGHWILPFQYRVLMAWLLSALEPFIGAIGRISHHLPRAIAEPHDFILFLVSGCSLFGTVLFTRGSLVRLTQDRAYSRWAALIAAAMAYFHFPLVFGLNFRMPYDLPSLFFFSGCLFAIIVELPWLYFPLFVLGAFNRETICMAALFYLLWQWQAVQKSAEGTGFATQLRRWFSTRQGQLATLSLVLQAALWIVIKLQLRRWYINNPVDNTTGHLYYRLGYNLHELVKPQQWPIVFSIFGFTLPLVLGWRRSMRNAFLEESVWIMAVWFFIMMMTGVIEEIRIFAELISYMSLAVAMILYQRFYLPSRSAGPSL